RAQRRRAREPCARGLRAHGRSAESLPRRARLSRAAAPSAPRRRAAPARGARRPHSRARRAHARRRLARRGARAARPGLRRDPPDGLGRLSPGDPSPRRARRRSRRADDGDRPRDSRLRATAAHLAAGRARRVGRGCGRLAGRLRLMGRPPSSSRSKGPPHTGERPNAPAAKEWVIPEALGAQPLARALRTLLGGASWNTVRRTITTGEVRLHGAPVVEVTRTVRAGQRLELVPTAPRPSAPRLAAEKLVHVDAHVVGVEKPPHVSTVPYDDTGRDTLDALVERELSRRERGRRGPLGVVHRLDKETSGLLVFARTLAAKRHLKNQFRFHTVARRYWALVSGHLESRTLRSRLVADRGDGRRGST